MYTIILKYGLRGIPVDYFNDELEDTTEKELEGLCIQFIEMLKSLKNTGRITEEEFHSHIKLKEEYVKYRVNKRY